MLESLRDAAGQQWLPLSLAARLAPAVALLAMCSAFARAAQDDEAWRKLAPFFSTPPEFAGKMGGYRSPLLFDDGRRVENEKQWRERREQILRYWHKTMGEWPQLIEKPSIEYLSKERVDDLTRHKVRIELGPQRLRDAYLLVPDGKGPFPAVLVVYYDPETGAGLKPETKLRDFGLQLARRGFVALSMGDPGSDGKIQPLSHLAYCAANACNILANLPEVDAKRIGVVGHSFGGKWAMFASCLYERFACACWCDPGVVWNEKDPNANYWEKWYLGLEPGKDRKPGIPSDENPRTGAYRSLVEAGRDMQELHALMAPRPFLVSGGAQDRPEHWTALNHAIAVNRLLGREERVGMTIRDGHSPTEESNAQIYAFFEHFLKGGPEARGAGGNR